MVRWTLLFVVLVTFASGGIAFYTVFFRPAGEITIPLLRERSVIDAVSEAERLGFTTQIEYVVSSLPEGRVLGQSPEAGSRARKSQIVVLQVSKGGELRAVPDVRGQTLARAQSLLKTQGFDMGDVIRIPDGSKPGGTVIAQSPASPANIALGRRVSLLVADGTGPDGSVVVPDVNRMTEREARNLIEGTGLKIAAIERVYSVAMPEGLAIETRPGAGTQLKAGDGVRLKVATLKQPAGFGGSSGSSGSSKSSGSGSTQRAVVPALPPAPTTQPDGSTGTTGRSIVVQVPGQGDVVVADIPEPTTTNGPIVEVDPNVSVFDQERRSAGSTGQAGQAQTRQSGQAGQNAPSGNGQVRPALPQTQTPEPSPQPSGGNKTARIRYQVPPLTSPLPLRIDVTDPSGTRTVLNRQVKSNESVSLQASYSQECLVSFYLGGNQVWQEKYK